MTTHRRLLALLVAAVLGLAPLAACGSESTTAPSTDVPGDTNSSEDDTDYAPPGGTDSGDEGTGTGSGDGEGGGY